MPSFHLETVAGCFAHDYSEARDKFRDACARRGLSITSHKHPKPGPNGLDLAVDVAWSGPRDAENIVLVISGTHGLEGLAGSGCQVWWLREAAAQTLPPNTAVLLVHMLNPWGAAWGRRQTEDNVDLNRNFLDFSQPLPKNPHYDALREAFHCPDRAGPLHERAQATIAEYARTHGNNALAAAIFQGQYVDADGLGFGGAAPTWSNRTFHQILQDHAQPARRVAMIDLHTGLGPYGHGMLINANTAGSPGLRLAQAWYGHHLTAIGADPSLIPYSLHGDMCTAAEQLLPHAAVVPVALEFGTFEVADLLQLQIDACWLYKQADHNNPAVREVQNNLWRFFYPATDHWFQMLCFRTHQVINMAMRGLAVPS